jgi:hypothetical protein
MRHNPELASSAAVAGVPLGGTKPTRLQRERIITAHGGTTGAAADPCRRGAGRAGWGLLMPRGDPIPVGSARGHRAG